jgi:hypothetical protein
MQHTSLAILPLLQILAWVNKYSVLAPPQEISEKTGNEGVFVARLLNGIECHLALF